jgi:hypothetical protein
MKHTQELFRSGPDAAPRKSLAEIFPLKRGEIRQLKIDPEHYNACKLSSDTFYVKKYYVHKGENPNLPRHPNPFEEEAIVYVAVLNKKFVETRTDQARHLKGVLSGNYIAVRSCAEGQDTESNWMITSDGDQVGESGNFKSAKQCGMATILCYLCYRDKELEPSIMGQGLGYDFKAEIIDCTNFNIVAAEKLKKAAEENCKRVMKVITISNPSAGGRAYVYASMDAGYELLMAFDRFNPGEISVVKTATLTEEFQQNPVKIQTIQDQPKLIDPVLDPFEEKHGVHWYFCKQKA